MRRPLIATKSPVEGAPRMWSSPDLEVAAEVLQELRASIRALEESKGAGDTATALAHAAKSLSKLQQAAGALSNDDARLTGEDLK